MQFSSVFTRRAFSTRFHTRNQFLFPSNHSVLLSGKSFDGSMRARNRCVSLKDRADQSCLLTFPRDDMSSRRYRHFLVFDGDIHYWSRFECVIVSTTVFTTNECVLVAVGKMVYLPMLANIIICSV